MIDLSPQHLATVERILAEHVPQCEVRAFGSRVRWTAKDYSDLDLAVVCEGELDRRLLERLQEAFVESDLPMRVDVLDWWRIEESFREVIGERYEVLGGGSRTVKKWRAVSLGEVAEDLTVGYVGPMASEYVPCGVPFLRSQNVRPFRVEWSGVKFITQEFHAKISKSALNPGDVIIVRTGKPGTAAVVPARSEELNCSDLVIVRPGEKLDSWYLCYHINGIAGDHVSAHLVGAVQQHFNVSSARKLPLFLPPLPEQRRITAVLGALDDKIELNRKMNRTLEAMAQAIFKSWFIDFDGHADLVDSELGPIPRGWEVGRLEELLTLQRGFDLPKSRRHPGRYRVIAAGGVHGSHNQFKVTAPGVVTGRSGKLGEVFLVEDDFWPLNTTLWVKNYGASRPYHAYHLLKTLDLGRFNAGSAVPTLNRNHVHSLRVTVPAIGRVKEYEQLVSPFFRQRGQNRLESITLAALRDTLLPKLISGEIRVPEAERAVEEVVA